MTRKIYSPIPVATLLCSVALAYFLDRDWPVAEVIPPSFQSVGWVIIGLAIVLMVYSVITHVKSKTTLMPGEVPTTLITSGLFKYSRNPIYLLDVAAALGAAITLGSITAFVAPLICFLVLNFMIIPFEEKNLHERFGKTYEDYRKSVRRWI